MIERGAAVDVEGHFSDSEEDAREARRGLWAGKFKTPWEWRGVEAGY
jgi:endonuclease YncB( thermonuclease family)